MEHRKSSKIDDNATLSGRCNIERNVLNFPQIFKIPIQEEEEGVNFTPGTYICESYP